MHLMWPLSWLLHVLPKHLHDHTPWAITTHFPCNLLLTLPPLGTTETLTHASHTAKQLHHKKKKQKKIINKKKSRGKGRKKGREAGMKFAIRRCPWETKLHIRGHVRTEPLHRKGKRFSMRKVKNKAAITLIFQQFPGPKLWRSEVMVTRHTHICAVASEILAERWWNPPTILIFKTLCNLTNDAYMSLPPLPPK